MSDPTSPTTIAAGLLVACEPRAELVEQLRPFDRLIGSWSLQVTNYLPDGTTVVRPGEWHFSWALDGRAVIDVWITPERATDADSREWGVTVRFFDPMIQAWRSTWHGPKHGAVLPFIGRSSDGGIVLEGHFDDTQTTRWIFSDIRNNSFHWRAEEEDPAGTVRIVQTMAATRVDAPAFRCRTNDP